MHVEAEFDTFLSSTAGLVLPDGRQRWFAMGMIPFARFRRGSARWKCKSRRPAIEAQRRAGGYGSRRIFCPNGRGARRASTPSCLFFTYGGFGGDFQEALAALLGKGAPNLSAAVIARLKSEWEGEYRQWQKSDLSARHYAYVWADGVYLQARIEPQAECMLVLIGATRKARRS